MATSEAISMLVSPAPVGALYVGIGLAGIALLVFITFCFAVAALLKIRLPWAKPSVEGSNVQRTFEEDAIFGWKYIAARPGLMG